MANAKNETASDNDDFKNTSVLVVAAHKGGAGKTTTCVHLAAELGRAGKKVLVIDMDPQFNASLHIGLKYPAEVPVTAADLVQSDSSPELLMAAIHEQTNLENVSLIYGSLKLDQAAMQLNFNAPRPSEVLRDAIDPLIGVFDIIIIDTPPSLGLLTSNALAAATHVIIPIESGSQYGMYGSIDLSSHLNKIRRINPQMQLLGVLLIRHDGRQLMCKAVKEAAQKEFGKLIPVTISTSSKFNRAAAERTGIHSVDRTSKVAIEFRELSRYVMKSLGIPFSGAEADDAADKPASGD